MSYEENVTTVLTAMGYTPDPDPIKQGWWHPPGEPGKWVSARVHIDGAFVERHLLPWLHSKGVDWSIAQTESGAVWSELRAHPQAEVHSSAATLTEAVLNATAMAVEAGWFAELAEQVRAR